MKATTVKGRMKATVYLHSNKESMWDLGVKLGLTSEALSLFKYACCEVKVELEVAADGNAVIVAVDDRPLGPKP